MKSNEGEGKRDNTKRLQRGLRHIGAACSRVTLPGFVDVEKTRTPTIRISANYATNYKTGR